MTALSQRIQQYWRQPEAQVPTILKFLSRTFEFVSVKRRRYFSQHPEKVYHAPVPVIVVGNIYVGGTGKTPVILALSNILKEQGIQVGIISRGYASKIKTFPRMISASSDPSMLGDEPCLIAAKTGCPVVIDPNRKRGIKHLLQQRKDIQLILSDDGLQHYAMARDMEIVVVDQARLFGNGLLLPAGPLREPVERLEEADFVLYRGKAHPAEGYGMLTRLKKAYSLQDPEITQPITAFAEQMVHAVAGIGYPDRFFKSLSNKKIKVIRHRFKDHHAYQASDFAFADDKPILMTEKDAVKCRNFNLTNTWVVPLEIELAADFVLKFQGRVNKLLNR